MGKERIAQGDVQSAAPTEKLKVRSEGGERNAPGRYTNAILRKRARGTTVVPNGTTLQTDKDFYFFASAEQIYVLA